jgi:HlyD family secretion protein
MTEPSRSLFGSLRPRWIVIALSALALVVLAQRLTSPVEVSVVRLEQRDIRETLAVVGRVRAPSRAALGASISGTITEVRVREGDRVSRGDQLVALEAGEAGAAVRQAEATLVETQATALQAIAEAEREAEQSRRDLERIEAVVAEGGFNPQRVEQAQQRAADAGSRLEALRAEAGSSGELASVARARAALEAARARLALTRIRAPESGVVLARRAEPGDAVAPGRILLEMAFDGPTELVVFPGEENLAKLEVGAEAIASADAYPDRTFPSRVALIVPAVDPSQGTVEVRMSIEEPPGYLLPDMTVSVNIEVGRKVGADVLPEDAVQGLGGSRPWVGVVRDGTLERQEVSVGLRASGFVEVLSGVGRTDAVARFASEDDVGSRVRVVEETSEPVATEAGS